MYSAMHAVHKCAVPECAVDKDVRLDAKPSICGLQPDHVNVCIGMLIIYVIPAT